MHTKIWAKTRSTHNNNQLQRMEMLLESYLGIQLTRMQSLTKRRMTLRKTLHHQERTWTTTMIVMQKELVLQMISCQDCLAAQTLTPWSLMNTRRLWTDFDLRASSSLTESIKPCFMSTLLTLDGVGLTGKEWQCKVKAVNETRARFRSRVNIFFVSVSVSVSSWWWWWSLFLSSFRWIGRRHLSFCHLSIPRTRWSINEICVESLERERHRDVKNSHTDKKKRQASSLKCSLIRLRKQFSSFYFLLFFNPWSLSREREWEGLFISFLSCILYFLSLSLSSPPEERNSQEEEEEELLGRRTKKEGSEKREWKKEQEMIYKKRDKILHDSFLSPLIPLLSSLFSRTYF